MQVNTIAKQLFFTTVRIDTIAARLYFVGVIAQVFMRKQWNEIVAMPIPTINKSMVQNEEMIDLGVVFKARTVIETIEAFLKAYGVDTLTPITSNDLAG